MTNEDLKEIALEHGGFYGKQDQELVGEYDPSYKDLSLEEQVKKELSASTGNIYGKEEYGALINEEANYIKELINSEILRKFDIIVSKISSNGLLNLMQRRFIELNSLIGNFNGYRYDKEIIDLRLFSDFSLIKQMIMSDKVGMNYEEIIQLLNEYKKILNRNDIDFKLLNGETAKYDNSNPLELINVLIEYANQKSFKPHKEKVEIDSLVNYGYEEFTYTGETQEETNRMLQLIINENYWKKYWCFLTEAEKFSKAIDIRNSNLYNIGINSSSFRDVKSFINSLSTNLLIAIIKKRCSNTVYELRCYTNNISDEEIENNISEKLDNDFRLIYAALSCNMEGLDISFIEEIIEKYKLAISKTETDFIMIDAAQGKYKGNIDQGYLTASKVLEKIDEKINEYHESYSRQKR